MPFRAAFDCLWCGRPWQTRSDADLEGWASLCPDCLGRAQDNAFLRYRLKAALRERSVGSEPGAGGPSDFQAGGDAGDVRGQGTAQSGQGISGATVDTIRAGVGPDGGPPGVSQSTAGIALDGRNGAAGGVSQSASGIGRGDGPAGVSQSASGIGLDDEMRDYYAARAGEFDDWYLRRGRYSRGPVRDLAWHTELDQATGWLDRLPLHGEIVELAAGTGWWSPLLAQKGELSIYDINEAPLERARDRLVAHNLRAHIHVRDAWEEPDRRVDALFCGFWLSHITRDRLDDFLGLVRRWLRPDGMFVFIDSKPDPESGAVDHDPVAADGVSVRRRADGREFRIPKVHYSPDELAAALLRVGFRQATVEETPRFFLLGSGLAWL